MTAMVRAAAESADDHSVWMLWALGGLTVWLVVALLVGLVVGRGIRLADRRSADEGAVLTTADIPGFASA
ncbi:hypothetical protein [Geodermatophilus sp. SYSU D00815]